MKQTRWTDVVVILILAALLGLFLRPGGPGSGTTTPGPATSRGATTPTPAGSPVASLDAATPGGMASPAATTPPPAASRDTAPPAPEASPGATTPPPAGNRDATPPAPGPPPPAPPPGAPAHAEGRRFEGHLSIWGISLGSSRADVERVWGASVMQNNTPKDGIAYVYSRKAGATWEGPTVYYDAQDRVRVVSGESLEKNGRVVPDSALGVQGGAVHLDFLTENGQLKIWRTGVPACSDPGLQTPIVERTSFMLVAGHEE